MGLSSFYCGKNEIKLTIITKDNVIDEILFSKFYNAIDKISQLNTTYPTCRFFLKIDNSSNAVRTYAIDNFEDGYTEYWSYGEKQRLFAYWDAKASTLKNNKSWNLKNSDDYHLYNEDIDKEVFNLLEEYYIKYLKQLGTSKLSLFLYYPNHGINMHNHIKEDHVVNIYLYPKKSSPTIFKNLKNSDWRVNRMITFPGKEPHAAFNSSAHSIRSTINYFFKKSNLTVGG